MHVVNAVKQQYSVVVAGNKHLRYSLDICTLIEEAAKARGTGIAKRDPQYIEQKMQAEQAVIALDQNKQLAGFCYIETWEHNRYVVNSGLIVAPEHRKSGLAKKIKGKAFELSQKKYPAAKLFGLTTSLAVMKINSDLGYKPVTFSELPKDETFWKGCQSCVNHDILQRMERKHCLCTGMLYESRQSEKPSSKKTEKPALAKYERWLRFKRFVLLRMKRKKLLFL